MSNGLSIIDLSLSAYLFGEFIFQTFPECFRLGTGPVQQLPLKESFIQIQFQEYTCLNLNCQRWQYVGQQFLRFDQGHLRSPTKFLILVHLNQVIKSTLNELMLYVLQYYSYKENFHVLQQYLHLFTFDFLFMCVPSLSQAEQMHFLSQIKLLDPLKQPKLHFHLDPSLWLCHR